MYRKETGFREKGKSSNSNADYCNRCRCGYICVKQQKCHFFAITWVIGMLTAILIQFLWYKKPIAAVGLVLVSFAIAVLAALALHYLIGI